MSLSEQEKALLLKQRHRLQSSMQDMAIAGIEIPAAMTDELTAVYNQLQLLEAGSVAPRDWNEPRDWLTFLGAKFGDFKISYLIEEGLYWYLFCAEPAVPVDDARLAMIKIAKDPQAYGMEMTSGSKFVTRLIALVGDMVQEVQPQKNALIDVELVRLRGTTGGALPSILADGIDQTERYFITGCFSGQTLRQVLDQAWLSGETWQTLTVFARIVATLQDLIEKDGFAGHGNLKPDNIMLTEAFPGGIFLRELGDFCQIHCLDKKLEEVRITTPQYYPWLDSDDICALGISLWEGLLNHHPFDDGLPSPGDSMISDDLKSLIDMEASLGNPYLLPLLNFKRPYQLGMRVSEKLEHLLLKSIRLQLGEDGKIYDSPGYESMSQFKDELMALIKDSQNQKIVF